MQASSGLGTTNHGLSLRRTGTFSTSGRNHTPTLGTWYAIRWKNPWERNRDSKKRIKIQDLVRHSLILCGAQVPQGRASQGNLARELSEASSLEKGKRKKEKGRSKCPNPRWTQLDEPLYAEITDKMKKPKTGCLIFFDIKNAHTNETISCQFMMDVWRSFL